MQHNIIYIYIQKSNKIKFRLVSNASGIPPVAECINTDITPRFTVADWLTHLAATLEVMGSRPSLGDISQIYFLESIQSMAQGDLKWSV